MRFLVISVLFVCSCASPLQAQKYQAEEFLPPGSTKIPKKFAVDFNKLVDLEISQFTSSDIKQVMDVAIGYMTDPITAITALDGWRIGITMEWIKVPDMTDPLNKNKFILAGGIIFPQKKIILVFAFQKCLADSDLVHEFAHALGYDIHTKYGNKWVEEIKQRVVDDLCGPDYKSSPIPPPNVQGFIKKTGIEL